MPEINMENACFFQKNSIFINSGGEKVIKM
jgi:hypothetical protein